MIFDFLKKLKKDEDPLKVGAFDVLREIPSSTKKVLTSIAKFGKGVQEEIAKSGASVGLTLTAPITGKREIVSEELDPDMKIFKEFIFGKDPIKAIETRIAEGEIKTKEIGKKYEIETFEKHPLAVSAIGVGAVIGLDFTGYGGGKKQALNVLTKSKNIKFVSNTLKQLNVADDLITSYAPKIAKMSKADDVSKALTRLEDLQKTTKIKKPAEQVLVPKKFDQLLSKSSTGIPSKRSVAVNLPDTRSQELLTSLKGSKPKSVSTILNVSPSNFTSRSFIHSYITKTDEISKETLPAFQKYLQEATGKVADVRVKKSVAMVGKIERYLLNKKNPATISDNLAGRVVVDSSEIPTQLNNINRNFNVVETQNFFNNPTNWGYEGINMKVKMPNGVLAEVQIHTPESLAIANKIHGVYEKWRNIDLTKLSSAQKSKFVTDLKKSQAIYQDIKGPGKVKPKGFQWKKRGFLESVRTTRPEIPLRVGGQYVPRSTDRLAMKAKTLINENIDMAEKMARTGTDDHAIATASELIKHYSDEALKAKSQATKDVLYEKAADIAHITARNLTDQGRAVQSASIFGRLTPEGILRFAAKEINKYNELVDTTKGGIFGLRKKIPSLTAKQSDEILTEMKRIEAMPDGSKKAIAFHALNNKISDFVPSSLYKKIINIWKAGLLTGIKTSGLNTFSNLHHGVSEIIKDIPAVVIDSAISIFSKKRTIALTIKETPKGTMEGFKKGWRYLKTGYDERNIAIKLDWKRVSFGKSKFAKSIQKYEETIFHLMGAEDQPFYYGAKSRSLMSQAIAQAKNAKLKGAEAKKFIENLVSNPTDEMLKYATTDAEMAVFQNPTMLGKIAKAIQNAPLGEFVVPFGRTPSAVATQLINYSPAGIVKTIIENIGKGRFDQRLFSQAIGRGITGTAIMAIGAEIYKKGLVTLNYPKTEKERELWKLEGRKANTIKIGDKYRNVNVLGPAGPVLLTGAHYQNALDETGSHFHALTQSIVGAAKSLTEQTFLQGINQVVSALNDPERYGSSYFENTIASFIPTIIGDIAKATDPLERRTTGILGRLKAKIPGVRKGLEPQITVLGEERKRAGNWWETMFDPSRPSKEISSNVINELRRLFDAGHKVTPPQLGNREGYEGLSPEENNALWVRSGELINLKLNRLFDTNQYQKAEDDMKADAVEDFVKKSNVIARTQMVMELTEGLNGQALKDKLSELKNSGLMAREIFKKYLELK